MNRRYFVDRSLGRESFPKILEDSGLSIVRHDDRFGQTTPDEEWLEYTARRGLVAVTGDDLIRSELGRKVIRDWRATVVIVVKSHIKTRSQARNFVNTLHLIERRLRAAEPPTVLKLYRPSPSEAIQQGKAGRVQDVSDRLARRKRSRSDGRVRLS